MRKRDMERIRKILVGQRDLLLGNVHKALTGDIHLDRDSFSDEIDTATSETSIAFTGRLRERERGLLGKIEQTLEKLEGGEFGECEMCGEEIGMKRLLARPVAALCIDCKAEQETLERRMG